MQLPDAGKRGENSVIVRSVDRSQDTYYFKLGLMFGRSGVIYDPMDSGKAVAQLQLGRAGGPGAQDHFVFPGK